MGTTLLSLFLEYSNIHNISIISDDLLVDITTSVRNQHPPGGEQWY